MATLRGSTTEKLCFVTIGATASFDSLIKATLSLDFLDALRTSGYTDLLLQHGNEGGSILQEFLNSSGGILDKQCGINIKGFDFNKKGLGVEMRAAKGNNHEAEGVVISHAGSGSILDALRISVPLIVVPNPTLLDNHQIELAEELAAQGYVVHGHLDDLPAAIGLSEALRKKQSAWPPSQNVSGRGLASVMDDEMGFVD